jgi:D-psicose/D-tagatose/L-ribulose 3-epimerase
VKIGINTWVWVSPFSTQDIDLIPRVKTMGFDAIEIAAEEWSLINIEAVKTCVQQHDLEITAGGVFGPTRDLIHDDENIRRNAFSYLAESIINTAKLGGSIFSGPLYSAEGKAVLVSADQKKIETERFVMAMEKLMRIAEDHGVLVCLEPANRFETSFVNTVEQANTLVDLVDHPNLGILLDAFHMSIEEKNMGDAIRRAGQRLKHFHACENDRGTPGNGLVVWEDIKNALQDIGYAGHITIESFTPYVPALASAAYIWKPLVPEQDQLARNGLTFLRKLFS